MVCSFSCRGSHHFGYATPRYRASHYRLPQATSHSIGGEDRVLAKLGVFAENTVQL